MFEGSVDSIYIADEAGAAVTAISRARAVPGKGLEGDRYFKGAGTFSKPTPDRELTLIEIEAVEALKHEKGIELEPGSLRRNVVTRDVPLNHLVGREFMIGGVRARGLKLCEPCTHLAGMTHEGVVTGLLHRCGLRAQIITEGTIAPGDRVAPLQ
jgi:MOSC domain-containing protein YiiM